MGPNSGLLLMNLIEATIKGIYSKSHGFCVMVTYLKFLNGNAVKWTLDLESLRTTYHIEQIGAHRTDPTRLKREAYG